MGRDMPMQSRLAPLEDKVNVEVSTGECVMEDHGVEVTQGEDGLNGVETWLGAMDVKVGLEDTRQMTPTALPSTPSLKLLHLQHYEAQLCEEVSPTDSNFSSDQIFDPPYSPTDSSCISARNRCEYPDTEASSLDDEDELRARKELLASAEQSNNSDVDSANSTTPLDDSPFERAFPGSSLNLAPTATVPPSGGFDPAAPHLIYLTSCLQCTLSGLRCSRTLPACSRCKRHGHGDLCLVQRNRHHTEVFGADDSVDTDPILLIGAGDHEGIRQQKVQLQNELLKTWREKEERKNWVMPVDDGIRGDWKTAVLRKVVVHPGVGTGPPAYCRLRVVLWHENAKRGRVGAHEMG